jgi:Antitoxin VbhA
VAVYSLYLDASGTHGASPVYILAGLAVHEQDAYHLQQRFAAPLAGTPATRSGNADNCLLQAPVQLPASLDHPIALPYNEGMPKDSVTSNGASNGVVPAAVKVSRKQAAANADGLLCAEGLQMSAEHQALSARWVAGEIDGAELERLGLELVHQRLATAAVQ